MAVSKLMNSPKFSFLAFHSQRLLRAHPVVVFATAASIVLAGLSGVAFLSQLQHKRLVAADLNELLATSRSPLVVPQIAQSTASVPTLPQFSSAELVETVNQIAVDIGLPVDEISYTLEEGASHPYLRYRLTLSATANYPLMRRFVDAMAKNLPHSILDSISCSRDDIAVTALSCDLAFSAFFQKGSRG